MGKRKRRGKRKRKGVEGPESKRKKRGKGGCKRQGVGIEKDQGENPRVWRIGGLGPVWGTLSGTRTFIFFCKLIWQIIFENGDDCLDKTFPTNLVK